MPMASPRRVPRRMLPAVPFRMPVDSRIASQLVLPARPPPLWHRPFLQKTYRRVAVFWKGMEHSTPQTDALALLRSARRIGFVFSGGSSRCVFQVGVAETLLELGIRPAVCVGVSAGAWNAAAVAVGTGHRLRSYWRAFARMPYLDLGNLLRERSPFRFAEMHRRTFSRYVGAERLRSPQALPPFFGETG